MLRLGIQFALALAMLPAGTPVLAQPVLQEIAPFVNYGVSQAHSISADGRVVVGFATAVGNRRHAFRWEVGGSTTDLGVLPGYVESFAQGVNGDGSVVVGYCNPSGGQLAFRWSAETGMQELPSGSAGGQAHGVSGDGSIVVGWATFPFGGRRWQVGGATQSLEPLQGGQHGLARSITPDGAFVAGYSTGSPSTRAVRWNPEGMPQDLGLLQGTTMSVGTGLSADGSTVIGYCAGGVGWRGFRWTEDAGMELVGMLPGAEGSVVNGISQDGRSLVGFALVQGERRAILETAETGLVDLNTYLPEFGIDLSGWVLNDATSISADGTALAGYGLHNGVQRAWVARGIPAPGPSVLLLGTAILTNIRRRRADLVISYLAAPRRSGSSTV